MSNDVDLGRIYKGEEYDVTIPIQFSGDVSEFQLYFYTDSAATIDIPLSRILIEDGYGTIHFQDDEFDPINDGVLKYYLKWSLDSREHITCTNTLHYLKTADGYNPRTVEEMVSEAYTSGITYQKSLLVSTAITDNGVYEREDGFSSVDVNIGEPNANVGDIVVYNKNTNRKEYIHYADYDTTTFPTETYVPIGIVFNDQVNPSGNVKMMSLDYMDGETPDIGRRVVGSDFYLSWGPRTVIGSNSRTDGRYNTNLVLTFATEPSDWRTAQQIERCADATSNKFPLFQCAWRYHTIGTNQGDWYIGAVDEIYDIFIDSQKFEALNNSYSALGITKIFSGNAKKNFGTSTEKERELGSSVSYIITSDKSRYTADKTTCRGTYLTHALYCGEIPRYSSEYERGYMDASSV